MDNHNTDNSYDVYDEVLEYLLGEGYSFDEANGIMVSVVNEAGIGDVAQFVRGRLATPLRTAATDLATTAISLTGLGKGKPPVTRVPSPSPTQVVRQAPARPAPKPPSVVRIPNPWQGSSSGSRLPNVLRGNQGSTTPAVQPRLRGSNSNVRGALTGSTPRASLPSGTRGGAIVRTTPSSSSIVRSTPSSSAITNTRTARPTTPAAQPRLTGSSPRASLPSGSGSRSITPTTRTVSSVSARSPIQPVQVRDITQNTQNLRRLAPSSQGTRALRPASGTPRPGIGRPPRVGMRGLGGGLLGGLGSVAVDMAFPEPTAPGTRDTAPRIPTSAGEVRKGQTYYDFSKRIGTSARPAAREKVGSKIVGSGKVGTGAQSFDKAYAQAKQKGGMGSTFNWKGNQYKVY